jgi:RNA polymerase sigma-70 factor (ECF subfamily)
MIAVCAGDAGAFERLVRRYESPLFNYTCRLLGNRADAQDVFQETFLRVFKHRARYRAGAPVRPWFYRIATNLCRDRLRYRRRHGATSLDVPAQGDLEGRPLADTLANGHPKPDAEARGKELEQRLAQAIGRLPLKQRSVFLLARYHGMAYGEIARSLRIPTGTVKSRMNKAVSFLLGELKDFVQ